MDQRIVWSEPASEDLAAIADYIARDSESYAAAFVHEVREAAASLIVFSERGQVVPEYGDRAIRELLVGRYRLVYHLSDDRVTILALIHGAQRVRAILKVHRCWLTSVFSRRV